MSKCECKECIHEKVCLHRTNIQTDTYAYMGVKYDTENCPHYKDKFLFVELPCAFGKKLYIPVIGTDVVINTKLLAIGIDEDGDVVYNPNEYPADTFSISGGEIGKTVFLDRAEAERKLREVGE